MRAGAMDRRIELQHRTLAKNAQGEKIASYAAYATVWAEKLDIRSREFFAAQTKTAEQTTRFRIRHRSDVVATDRIILDSVAYNVNGVSEIGRRAGLELFTTAVVT